MPPYIQTNYPNVDLVIVRENEEDTYAGIEHRQTEEVYQCLKLISRPGCEQIVQYAFEYARKFNRKKVTCLTKDNIMKMTDGLFHRVFNEIAAEYPEIEHEHLIVDIGTALIACSPERFDVIVTLNLYGDIISDVAAQVTAQLVSQVRPTSAIKWPCLKRYTVPHQISPAKILRIHRDY